MKKRPILNAYETKIFNEWIADGNAVEQTKGVWVEQSTQYRKKFTYEELQKFFKKEYLSYKGGGSAKDLLSSRAGKIAKKEKSLNLKAYNVPSVTYAINPLNEGLDEIFQDIVGKDELREAMSGVDFVGNTATGTDAFKLLHLVGKREGKFKDGNYYLFSTMENKWSKDKILSKEMSISEYYKQRSLIEQRFPNWIPIVYDSFDYKQEFNLTTLYDVLNSLLVSKLLNKEFYGIIIEFKTKDGAYQIGFNAKIIRSIIKSLIMAGITDATGYFNTPRNGVTILDTSLKFPNKNKRDEFFMENSFGLVMPIMIPDEETLEEIRKEGLKMAEFDNLVYEFPIIRLISPNEYEIEIYGQDTITYSRGKSIQIKSKKTQPKPTPQSTTKTTDKKTALGNKLRKGMVVRIEYKESNGSTLSNDLFFDDGKFIKYILITDKKGKEISETEETLSETELNEYYKEYKEYIIDEFYENMAEGGQLGKQMTLFNTGGKIGFDALAKKVAKRYAGEKVEPQYQAEYGKKYSKSEAEEVGRKVAGKVYWQQQGRKFNGGGEVKVDGLTKQDFIDAYLKRVEYVIENLKQKGEYDTEDFDLLQEVDAEGGFTDVEDVGYWLRWAETNRNYDALVELIDLGDYREYNNYTVNTLAHLFFGKPMKLDFYIIQGGDSDSAYNDELQKIKLLLNKIDFDKVTGKIEYEQLEDNTNLKFYKDGKLVMSLKGDYNDETDELDTTINVDGETAELNYHPYDGFGNVDMQQLNKNINEAFTELNTYSAVVSIEGYEEYAEDVEGLENAKSLIQDIKGNTRFQVLKGSRVGIGKRVDSSKVVAEFNGGGGVDGSEMNKILEKLEEHYLFGSRGMNLVVDIQQAQNPRLTTYWETIARKDDFKTELYEWLKKYDIVGGYDSIWVADLEKINNWKAKIKELKFNGYLVVKKISAPDKKRTKSFRYIAIKQKFDNGGSVPNLNKMFHLPIEMAVYVPSTQDVNNVISVDEMEKRVREVKEYLANKFGGYTSAEKIGGFVDSQAELVNEEVVQITAFSTKEAYEENKEALVQKLSDWAKEWGQEAIGFEYEGDLMYVPQKFVGGGKAIRQTQFAVYKLLDKEGLVKYFTDTDLEKFLQEWNEDYNTDYEDFVEFNEYEREFIIKPVFSKNDMGGTASQTSFLEIQINDVPNWENYELANYLDAPISLVAKNRNFYVKEVQNEMMLNVIPNYAGGGSAKKSTKYNPLNEYYEKYTNGGFVGGDVIKFKYDGKDFTRKVESVDEMGNAVVNIMKTQKATINPADVFEIKKEKDDKSIIIEKIGLNEENANFLIGLSPTFAVWLADSIVDAYTTIQGEQGLTREQSLTILNKNPRLLTQLSERIRGILDWLQHPSTPKQNLRELTFSEAERKAKEWHDELTTSGGDLNFIEPIENTVLVTYPPNEFGKTYYWVFIPKNYCDIESSRMGHCGRTGAGSLISLRSVFKNTNEDTITDSHVTIAYNKDDGLFYQAKGKQNRKPIEKYFPYIFDLIKMMASGQVTENFKLLKEEKIKELQGQKIELEKEVNKLQKYFESKEARTENVELLVEKATIFQNEKKKLENINSQIEKLNEESSFDFNGFGSEYQSSNDYGYEDMTKEQIKELYEIKPDMFNDFAGQFMLYEAGLIDEKPNTSFLLEKDVDYVVDLLRVDRSTSDSLVAQVLSGESYDLIDAGYY